LTVKRGLPRAKRRVVWETTKREIEITPTPPFVKVILGKKKTYAQKRVTA